MKNERRNFGKALIFVILFATLAFLSIGIGCASATTTTIYVPEGGNQTIQQAVNNASAGDTIIVRDGTYIENVDVNVDNLTIQSENGSASTTVQALDTNDHVFAVAADYVTIKGFMAKGASESYSAGICLVAWKGVDNCNITNNTLSNNHWGIYLDSSSQSNTIANNNALNNAGGISLHSTSNNIIIGNNLSSNTFGFWFDYGAINNIIFNNIVQSSKSKGIWIPTSGNNLFYLNNFNNTVNVGSYGSTNIWNSTEKISYTYNSSQCTNYMGNYWDDYTGSDTDKDGIGDTPYSIDSDADKYPLMEMFEKYFAPQMKPYLLVTEIKPNCDYLFANESNEICVTIENTGSEDADAFDVSFSIDGFSDKVRVSELAAGANTTVCVTDPTLRNAGDSVIITVTADCSDEVAESDETNNEMTVSETVVNNGYKGKRYTGGEDITTWKTFELNGNLLYSLGDSYYLSAYSYPDWTTYTVNWTATDLPVPDGTAVKEARLYVPYTWDKAGVMPDEVSLSFNGFTQTLDTHYSDEKGWATSYPYGMLAYDVTDDFDTSGNTAVLYNLPSGGGGVSMRGMLMVVVYADDSEPLRKIIMNEEFDLLYGGSSKCTTPAEATAYAPFGAIDTSDVETATLITVAPGAGPNEGDLLFNGQTWTDVWSFSTDAQIGIDERDVTPYLQSTENEAGFQSSADYMEASNAILIVEYKHKPMPTISIYTDKTSYTTGEKMHLGLDVKNPLDSAQNVGIDIWLEMPAYPWVYTLIHVPSIKLPAGLDYSNPDFKVIKLPPIDSGTYTWHAQLSNPITGEIICEDTAEWVFVSTAAPTEDITEVLEQTTVVIDFGE